MDFQSFLKSRFATWTLLIILVVSLVGFARVYLQKRQIDGEIAKLQNQADRIERDNEQLSELIKYFNTPEYQEKQAREKLNLKKEGETVVGLPETAEAGVAAGPNNQAGSNARLWFNYFFANNN